ncbi:MAG: hypothetical protein R2684_14665 [Pyrinomonadaceae bacterium]
MLFPIRPTVFRRLTFFLFSVALLASFSFISSAQTKDEIKLRFRIVRPASSNVEVTLSGYRHTDPWRFPPKKQNVAAGAWTSWIDLSDWPWHGRVNRSGGISEFPSVSFLVRDLNAKGKVEDLSIDVELADSRGSVKKFNETAANNMIVFVVPSPLRQNMQSIETGTESVRRHRQWATEVLAGKRIDVKRFEIGTSFFAPQHGDLMDYEAETLRNLGFNMISGVSTQTLSRLGLRTTFSNWSLHPDPDVLAKSWADHYGKTIEKQKTTPEGKVLLDSTAYVAISDEVRAVDFRRADRTKLDVWFREYLAGLPAKGGYSARNLAGIAFPFEAIIAGVPNRNASLADRKLFYNAARFTQIWSTARIAQTSDEIKGHLPNVETGVLVPSHGFFGGAWGPQYKGMSAAMLDLFDLGRNGRIDQISVEDWFGLNRMYGPSFTWTGGQTFSYYSALVRSAAGSAIKSRSFLTPSDDEYLRLKAYSGIGQGSKALGYWAYGPTIVGTENYWSDLKSEFAGAAKINRAISLSEDVLLNSAVVSDRAAIVYSVSHDIWNPDREAAFSEKRLLWHALRHEQVQPDFIDETDLEKGMLVKYDVLFLTDEVLTRGASAEINEWVKHGGVLYISAGAATRDEFYDQFLPGFAKTVWRSPAYSYSPGSYNERTTLASAKPLAKFRLDENSAPVNALGAKADLNQTGETFMKFTDGTPAGAVFQYGKGKIVALGVMPFLAYGQSADFKPETLSEKWKPEYREIIEMTLANTRLERNAVASVPVVETSLLKGRDAGALVLVNYTYQPQKKMRVRFKTGWKIRSAQSTEGKPVKIIGQEKNFAEIELDLDWTDIVVFR